MMSEWKQAWKIVLLELKLNKLGYLFMLLMSAIYLSFVITMNETSSRAVLVDIFLIILVWFPMVMRGKEYTGQKIENGLYASRFVMLLSQFPITKEVIIKSRVLNTLLFNVCLNVCFLTIIYIFVESLHSQLSGLSSLVFILFWLCFGYQLGAVMPANEIGATYTIMKLIVYCLLLYGFVAGVLFVFHYFLDTSLFDGSIYLAKEHTMITLFVLLILTIGTHFYGMYEAKKAIRRVDYYL